MAKLGSWRNWLAQESYTLKVGGSSPSLPTRSRIATLIVGRTAGAYDGSGVATAERSRKQVSELPMVEVELVSQRGSETISV